jgi:hypothetical protein
MDARFNRPIANRMFTLLALIAIAPALLQLIEIPQRSLAFPIFGAPFRLTLSVDTLLITLVPAFTVAGVDWVLREHPAARRGAFPYLFPFWIAPGLGAFALTLVLTQVDSWPLWVGAIALGIVALGVLIYGEYTMLSPGAPNYAVARLSVLALTFLVAFVLFTAIYGQRERTIASATAVALVAFLLSIELLNPFEIGLKATLLNALVIAALLAQAVWAANYWRTSNYAVGVLLLAFFYVLVGLSQQYHQGTLTRGVLVEYGVITVVTLAVVWTIR